MGTAARRARGRDRHHPWRRRYERLWRQHEQTRRIAERLASAAASGAGLGQHDALTGLANRSELHRRLDHLLAGGSRVAVLLLDLDRFKDVNDTLGHLAGDGLLREFAARLRAAVSPAATAARFGGDEFAVLLPDVGDDSDAHDHASRVRAALAAPVAVSGALIELESSIGLALAPDDGADSARLLHRADVAMYQAKRTRQGVVRYDPAHDPRSDAQLAFAGALRTALANGAIVVHYQPIARFDGTVLRFEALARWQHDELGMIEPSAFMVGAEQNGLVGQLSEYVLERALSDARDWRSGRDMPIGVAVNVAAANLVDACFPNRLDGLLRATGARRELVTLELRESAVLTSERARAVVGGIRQLGVRVSLDDFGRPPSSLTMVQALGGHEVKLDGAIVRGVLVHRDDARLAGAVVGASHALGLSVVAKEVESEAVWSRLASLGCDAAQGFHLGRPLPAREVLPWLSRRAM